MNRIAKTSLIVTIFTAIGLGLNFLSTVIIAAKFGAGRDMDVYLVATSLPLYIITIFAGTLNFTFIPVFSEYKLKDAQELWKIVSSFMNLVVLTTFVLCLAGMVFSYPLVRLLAPGFDAEKVRLSATLLSRLFPIIVFTSLNELMASVYYSSGRFIIPSWNKIISPSITIAYVLLFHRTLSTKSIVYAMLTSSMVQTSILSIGFFVNREFNYSFVLMFRHAGVTKILRLMAPLMMGLFIYSGVGIYDRFLLSLLPEGSISIRNYSDKILNLLTPLIITGIATTVFPTFSTLASENNKEVLIKRLETIMLFLAKITVPVMVFFAAYSDGIIRLIYERGIFSGADTEAVAKVMSLHVTVLLPMVFGSILALCFYATHKTTAVAVVGVMSAALYVATSYPLSMKYGIMGLMAATVFYWYISNFILIIFLRKILNWNPIRVISSTISYISIGFVSWLGLSHIAEMFGWSFYAAGFLLSVLFALIVFNALFKKKRQAT